MAFAVALAFAFPSVIPEGNLLLAFPVTRSPHPKNKTAPEGILQGRQPSRVYFAVAAFFAGAATTAFGFQNDRSSFVQLSGIRLIAGVNTNKFDTVLS